MLDARIREDRPVELEFLGSRCYREDRRSKKWELDLVKHRVRLLQMLDESRAWMRDHGIAILPLAGDTDPEKYRKLHAMSEEASQDVPTTIPVRPEPFDLFMQWLRQAAIHEDRLWIARQGDEIVGMSVLRYPPVRGNVGTDWTATARRIRGRGVARALKVETLAQAIAIGVTKVRTGNDAENAPILHLNEELGYERVPGWVKFLKNISG